MFGIVINQDGFKVAFCPLSEDKTTQYYELKDGEKVIEKDWNIANTMNKPKWDGVKWIDTEPLPPPQEPTTKEPNKIDILEQENKVLKAQMISTQKLCIGLQKQILLK